MKKFNLWYAKFLDRKIERDEKYCEKIKGWLKRDKAHLRQTVNKLTKEENLEYGYQCGYIERADYLIMKQQLTEEIVNGGKK